MKKKRRLHLNRKTIRALTDDQLPRAAGGGATIACPEPPVRFPTNHHCVRPTLTLP